jgi:PadR family transcriptional regulator, regulatory protein PadR
VRNRARCSDGFTIDFQNVRPIIIGVINLPRLSATERLILELLAEHGELFGLQMVGHARGALKRGTVYVTLGRMQEKGYLESRQELLPPGAIGLPRRLYRPSGYGLRVVNAWRLAERVFAGADPQEA